MRVKSDFVLREVAGIYVVIPAGNAALSFDGMLSLNNSGKMLWNLLETETTIEALLDALITKYTVSREEARQDVISFLDTLRSVGCLEE